MPQTKQAELAVTIEGLLVDLREQQVIPKPKVVAEFLAARLPGCAVHDEAWYNQQSIAWTNALEDFHSDPTMEVGSYQKWLALSHAASTEGGVDPTHYLNEIKTLVTERNTAQARVTVLSKELEKCREEHQPLPD